ncbi:hypothetical protein hmeg3_07495 [Herbaspirillum sp. meg3]|uniref:hypothetical protein n=1 Tax=Herbaspirillum sp. meg3 TaxID=2025949 RepID=UPI000B99030B|nr:hypothetical protein [Herbaspirillum sp. meg3]ASU38160.1 hypothetical protein hmeg3_07495 [Herbaspirillum sp. meg3]
MNQRFVLTPEQHELLATCASALDKELDALPLESSDLDAYYCDRSDLLDAIQTAPNKLTQLLFYSQYLYREHLSMITNRPFT